MFSEDCRRSPEARHGTRSRSLRSNPRVVGSNPTGAKFSLARGDSQISFNKDVYLGDLIYWQYCLLPAPYQLIKIPSLRIACSACSVVFDSSISIILWKRNVERSVPSLFLTDTTSDTLLYLVKQSFLPYAGRTSKSGQNKIVSKWQMGYAIFTFIHGKFNSPFISSHDIFRHTFVNTLVNIPGVRNQEWTVLLKNFPPSIFTTIIKVFAFIKWSCSVYSVTVGCYPSECWLWKTTSVTCERHVFFTASFGWWIDK